MYTMHSYMLHVRFVVLDDNARTEWKARELKSIHVDVYAEYIQLTMDKCHINPLNLFNQVYPVLLHKVLMMDSYHWIGRPGGTQHTGRRPHGDGRRPVIYDERTTTT